MLIFGFIFFVNPVPMGLDLFPDVFGCILIFFGLTQLAFFDGEIEKSKRYMLCLLITEAARLALMKSVFLTEISSNRMLAVTAFSIVEGMLYVLFFRSFFGGLSYFSMRNNCNKTLAKCDGCAFLSYLSFFVRLAATLIPELLAIIELEQEFTTDFDTLDTITEILASKPVLIVLLSLLALVTGVAWYISLCGLLNSFDSEARELLDRRYTDEYSSRPEMIRPKKLRNGSLMLYFALFFAADITLDGIRIIPASAMFLVMFIATFFLKDLSDFSATKKLCLPAFILLLCAEVFKAVFVPYGAIAIYETDLWIVAVGGIISVLAVPLCMLCVRSFLANLRRLSVALGGKEIPTSSAWVAYCLMMILWTIGYVVPYFYSFVSTLRFFAAVVFIWQTAKVISQINYEEYERFSLYGDEQ